MLQITFSSFDLFNAILKDYLIILLRQGALEMTETTVDHSRFFVFKEALFFDAIRVTYS